MVPPQPPSEFGSPSQSGIANACCLPSPAGDNVSPVPTTYDNVIIRNSPCIAGASYCLGYGIEAWGLWAANGVRFFAFTRIHDSILRKSAIWAFHQ